MAFISLLKPKFYESTELGSAQHKQRLSYCMESLLHLTPVAPAWLSKEGWHRHQALQAAPKPGRAAAPPVSNRPKVPTV